MQWGKDREYRQTKGVVGLGGGINRAPQNWGGGSWEKGSIDRTINQLL